MSSRYYTVFPATMASAGTLTGQVDLQHSWANVYLEIPAMTNSVHFIKAATDSGGTYRRIKHPAINSSTLTTNDYAIVSTATNCLVPVPNGFRFVKVESEIAIADGAVYKFICGD